MLMPHDANATGKMDIDVVIPIKIGTSEWIAMLLLLLVTLWFHWTSIRRNIADHLFRLWLWVDPEATTSGEVGWSERRFFVSPAGVCVHSDKDCRGLRTVVAGDKRSLRLCKVCCRECSSDGN